MTLAKLDNLSLIEWADSLPEEFINEALELIEKDELDLSTTKQTNMKTKNSVDGLNERSSLSLLILPLVKLDA